MTDSSSASSPVRGLNRKPLGHVTPLSRRLTVTPDPLLLYAAVADRPDTQLLESADRPHGERSIIVPRCALRMTGRGREVEVVALSPNGVGALAFLADQLDRYLVTAEDKTLRLRYPEPPLQASEADRLSAPSPLDALRTMACGFTLDHRPSAMPLIAVGTFAYDLIDVFERLPAPRENPNDFPDFVFWLPEAMIVIDHAEHNTTLLALVFGGPHEDTAYADAVATIEQLTERCAAPMAERPPYTGDSAEAICDQTDEEYAAAVTRARQHIVAGDVFQIVPSRTFSMPCRDPLGAYLRLRRLNPSPYMFFVRADDHTLFGASPETCVKVTQGRVEIRPIAGTRPRGLTPSGVVDADLDSRYEAELRLDEKELAEHMMLVDLARNDVSRVSAAGTRRVDRLLTVERYSHVMHLVSYLSGQLKPGLDALRAYAASMNMGTLVGAPKIRAAELLRELEATKRGPYGGAVGYLSCDGDMDTAIIIRSALVRDGIAYVRAGAGVVYDSDPPAEAAETRRKAQAVIKAIRADAEGGER